MSISVASPSNSGKSTYRVQLSIIGAFFFIFGFVTWTNGVLIPYLTMACDLKQEWQAYLVTFAFYISYTLLALPSGYILKRIGMVKGMQLGLIVMALGALVFVPSAMSRSYPLFLGGLFIIGAGLTLLQTAVNPYVTILGPVESAAQRISIMGICNKGAGALAPVILGAIILTNTNSLEEQLKVLTGDAREATLDELAHKVIMPFIVLAAALTVISFMLRFAHLPEVKLNNDDTAEAGTTDAKAPSIWNYPAVTLGFIAIFVTVAAEVVAGDTIGRYGQYHGFSLEVAGKFTSYTLFSMIAGYLVGVFAIPRFLSQEKGFMLSNFLGIALVILVMFVPGKASVAFLALLGFANALLWPAIWPAAIKNLPNRLVNIVSSILVMGIAGGAILPMIYGWLADLQNKQIAYWVLIPGYLFNLYYWKRCMDGSRAGLQK